MSTAASKAFHTVYPPRSDGKQAVQSAVTGAAAADANLWTGLGVNAPTGKVYLMLEAVTNDVYVVFKATDTAAAATTSNSMIIKAGQPGVSYWVDFQLDKFIDFISPGGAGVLKWYVASPEFDGQNVQ